jgi:hypothetical protein
MKLDYELLKAKIFHGLKSLQSTGDTLEPRFLEVAICESFGFTHVGDSSFYADGTYNDIQLSVKTRMINPHDLKRKEGRDFQTHPEKFLGPQLNQKHNRWTNGIEIVQRRQKLDLKNDSTAIPDIVGKETLAGFLSNIQESSEKYNTSHTYEVIGVHGYDKTKKNYIVSLFWKEYEFLDHSKIKWIREGYGVSGYIKSDNTMKKICERINGNAKREATCFKEYKDLTKYICSTNIKLPLPAPWKFDKDAILEEIYLKENSNVKSILFSE